MLGEERGVSGQRVGKKEGALQSAACPRDARLSSFIQKMEAIVAETRRLLFFFPAQSWRERRLWSQTARHESQLRHVLAG